MCIFDIKQSRDGNLRFVEPVEFHGDHSYAGDIMYQVDITEVQRLNLSSTSS